MMSAKDARYEFLTTALSALSRDMRYPADWRPEEPPGFTPGPGRMPKTYPSPCCDATSLAYPGNGNEKNFFWQAFLIQSYYYDLKTKIIRAEMSEGATAHHLTDEIRGEILRGASLNILRRSIQLVIPLTIAHVCQVCGICCESGENAVNQVFYQPTCRQQS